MHKSPSGILIVGIALFGAAVLICGCTEVSEITADKSVHVTAICDVKVIDKTGKPVAGIPVSFSSVKFTGTAPKEDSEFNFQRSTDGDGKTSFTVGYNLREQNIGFPVQDAISLSVSIPGDIADGAVIGYREAVDRAAGTGAAVITRTITLRIPYEVK